MSQALKKIEEPKITKVKIELKDKIIAGEEDGCDER